MELLVCAALLEAVSLELDASTVLVDDEDAAEECADDDTSVTDEDVDEFPDERDDVDDSFELAVGPELDCTDEDRSPVAADDPEAEEDDSEAAPSGAPSSARWTQVRVSTSQRDVKEMGQQSASVAHG